MADKESLKKWVVEALAAYGGKASILAVAEHIWTHHESKLRASGDLFYTWQYDMRWAATRLRQDGRLTPALSKGIRRDWELI